MTSYQNLNRRYIDILEFLQRELEAMAHNGLDSSRVAYSLEILQGGLNEISDLVAQAEELPPQRGRYQPSRGAMMTQMAYTRSPFSPVQAEQQTSIRSNVSSLWNRPVEPEQGQRRVSTRSRRPRVTYSPTPFTHQPGHY